ncbi:MAG: DUF3493 domain-containing protein [Cyanobacteria bacterium SBLK]|nr:DUF3493 domain-containing protein [Cyanobacteria bacterium SBLK]
MPDLNKPAKSLSPEEYKRLKAELKSPYRGLRRFIYLSFAASGGIGAFIFLAQLASGRDILRALPNFALQVGLVALMVWLLRRDR